MQHCLRCARFVRAGGVRGLWFVLLLSGCAGDHVQSALHPASPEAESIARLWWVMCAVFGTVFLAVLAFTIFAIARPSQGEKPSAPGGGNRFIVIAGIIVPAIILVAILLYSLKVTVALRPPPNGLTIQVIGHQFWWEIRYPELGIVTANEIHIPVDRPVRLELTSADVIHSFWVPNLHGKMDLLPGHTNHFWLRSSQPGTWRGQCAEYCGVQHARMAFMTIALMPEEFEAWAAERLRPRPEPTSDLVRRGQEVFFEAACNNCHAIRGTEATGLIGPDLTHMGTRLTVGAGQWPNVQGHLSGWIVNPQALKPGNLMPRSYLEPDDLHALVEYLQSLR